MIICTVPWGPEQLENKLGALPRDQAIRRAMESQGNPYLAADTLRA